MESIKESINKTKSVLSDWSIIGFPDNNKDNQLNPKYINTKNDDEKTMIIENLTLKIQDMERKILMLEEKLKTEEKSNSLKKLNYNYGIHSLLYPYPIYTPFRFYNFRNFDLINEGVSIKRLDNANLNYPSIIDNSNKITIEIEETNNNTNSKLCAELQEIISENDTKISENVSKISENDTKISENYSKIDNKINSDKNTVYNNIFTSVCVIENENCPETSIGTDTNVTETALNENEILKKKKKSFFSLW